MSEAEEWRWIPGWEDSYEVSSLGRVRSWRVPRARFVWNKFADKPRLLKLGESRNRRYLAVTLAARPELVRAPVSHLVLQAFRGPRPDGHDASHVDGNRFNNALSNLVWEPHISNMRRRREHGTEPIATQNGFLSRTRVPLDAFTEL